MVSRTTSLLDSLHTMCADNGNQNKLAHSTIPHMLRCPIGRGRPRRTEHRTGALAFPGESRGSLGERRQYYKPSGNLFQSSKKGSQEAGISAIRLSFPSVATTERADPK